MKHEGDLIIKKADSNDYSQITSVGGSLSIHSDVKLPNLTSVGGSLHIYSDVKLPNLTSVGGNLHIHSNAKLDVPNLTSVGGNLHINSNVKLPNLTSVGGSLYIYSDAKLDVPNLTSVGGSLSIYSDAKLDAPFLKNLKWKSIDGCLFVIESTKVKGDTTIYKGYNCKNVKDNVITKDECYVAKQGTFYAHGKTIKKAVEDLQFKVISEKLKKEPINKDTIIDVKYYRLVTGACEMGVQSFIKGNGLKESYTASELLPILEQSNAYGLSKFKELLTF
jgi:acyl-[acyl carrier protein]--UDP-N-acetylglucosamine O-acyltransferase